MDRRGDDGRGNRRRRAANASGGHGGDAGGEHGNARRSGTRASESSLPQPPSPDTQGGAVRLQEYNVRPPDTVPHSAQTPAPSSSGARQHKRHTPRDEPPAANKSSGDARKSSSGGSESDTRRRGVTADRSERSRAPRAPRKVKVDEHTTVYAGESEKDDDEDEWVHDSQVEAGRSPGALGSDTDYWQRTQQQRQWQQFLHKRRRQRQQEQEQRRQQRRRPPPSPPGQSSHDDGDERARRQQQQRASQSISLYDMDMLANGGGSTAGAPAGGGGGGDAAADGTSGNGDVNDLFYFSPAARERLRNVDLYACVRESKQFSHFEIKKTFWPHPWLGIKPAVFVRPLNAEPTDDSLLATRLDVKLWRVFKFRLLPLTENFFEVRARLGGGRGGGVPGGDHDGDRARRGKNRTTGLLEALADGDEDDEEVAKRHRRTRLSVAYRQETFVAPSSRAKPHRSVRVAIDLFGVLRVKGVAPVTTVPQASVAAAAADAPTDAPKRTVGGDGSGRRDRSGSGRAQSSTGDEFVESARRNARGEVADDDYGDGGSSGGGGNGNEGAAADAVRAPRRTRLDRLWRALPFPLRLAPTPAQRRPATTSDGARVPAHASTILVGKPKLASIECRHTYYASATTRWTSTAQLRFGATPAQPRALRYGARLKRRLVP